MNESINDAVNELKNKDCTIVCYDTNTVMFTGNITFSDNEELVGEKEYSIPNMGKKIYTCIQYKDK